MNATGSNPPTQATTEQSDVSTEVLATLSEIGEEVNASLDLDEVLSHTAVLIKRHIDYEFFGVMLLDETGSYLSHRFAVGYPPGLAENLRVPMGQGITGTAISTGQPVRVGDVCKTRVTSTRSTVSGLSSRCRFCFAERPLASSISKAAI